MQHPLLQVHMLEAGYGSSSVVQKISLNIPKQQVVTLLGKNGMGKSTLIKSIMGLVPLRSGSLHFNGQTIQRLATYQRARLGIAYVPEGRQIFPNLTVEENLLATAANRHQHSTPFTLNSIYAFFPRLKERAHNGGDQLSGGEQQMLAIGRALLTNPKLLILDEATEGLAPLVRAEIWRVLAQLRERGLTMLVVDKNINALAQLANHHYVIEKGQVVWQGNTAQLQQQRQQVSQYLGV